MTTVVLVAAILALVAGQTVSAATATGGNIITNYGIYTAHIFTSAPPATVLLCARSTLR